MLQRLVLLPVTTGSSGLSCLSFHNKVQRVHAMTKVKPSSLNAELWEGYSGGGGVEFGVVGAPANGVGEFAAGGSGRDRRLNYQQGLD